MQRPMAAESQWLTLLQIYSILNSGVLNMHRTICNWMGSGRILLKLICANADGMVTFATDKLPAILEARGCDRRLATTLQHRQLENHVIYGNGHVRTFPGIWVAQMLMPMVCKKDDKKNF